MIYEQDEGVKVGREDTIQALRYQGLLSAPITMRVFQYFEESSLKGERDKEKLKSIMTYTDLLNPYL